MEFTAQLTLESRRGRDRSGNPIVDALEPSAIEAGITVPLIRGMNLKDLIGTVQTGENGAVSGYTHEDSAPAVLYPAGTVVAFTTNPDGTRTISKFRLAAVSAGNE